MLVFLPPPLALCHTRTNRSNPPKNLNRHFFANQSRRSAPFFLAGDTREQGEFVPTVKFEPCTRNDGEAHSYIILRIFVPALSLQQSMRSSHQSCTHWAGEGAGVCVGPDVEGACTTTLHVIVALGIIKYVLRVSVTAK